jgi:hypothetical protein
MNSKLSFSSEIVNRFCQVIFIIIIVNILILLISGCAVKNDAEPPEAVYKIGDREKSLVKLPDGTFMLFINDGKSLKSITSEDCRTWTSPKVEIENQDEPGVVLVLSDREGELHSISMVRREVTPTSDSLRGPAATIMLDLWHRKTINKRKQWEPPKRIFEGYCGAVLDFKQLRSGRLIVPFAYWVAGQDPLPWGLNISTVVFSDDGGNTWHMSDAKLKAPAYSNYPGNNYGAIEPAVVELEEDGHLYMLMRTQTGFLYESFSDDNGTNWSTPAASRFYSFNGPPLLKELPERRIFLVWNNSDNSPKHKGQGVYGGRDAIHAAVSDDYGKTWKGFREIHRDPLRNETPPKFGDRGTSYANSPFGVNGDVMLITGMGEGRRHIVNVDVEWLTAKHHESDFSKGLEEWSLFKQFGPALRYWRDRVTGPVLVDHPSSKGQKVLHIRRPDEKDPDGAVWNFPNGMSGKLVINIMLNEGFKGGSIALTDRFFNPCDGHGERLAMFYLPVSSDGRLADGTFLTKVQWHKLEFIWDIYEKYCKVVNDGRESVTLPLNNETLNGLSYLRLRSTSPEPDLSGYFIESVIVDIDDNIAREVSPQEKKIAEDDYRSKLIVDEWGENKDNADDNKKGSSVEGFY